MSRASQSAARARQREDQKAGKRGTHPAEGAVARNRARRTGGQQQLMTPREDGSQVGNQPQQTSLGDGAGRNPRNV